MKSFLIEEKFRQVFTHASARCMQSYHQEASFEQQRQYAHVQVLKPGYQKKSMFLKVVSKTCLEIVCNEESKACRSFKMSLNEKHV